MGALPGASAEPPAMLPARTTLPKKSIIFSDAALKKGSEKWSVPDGWRVVWSDRLESPFFFNDPTQQGQVHMFSPMRYAIHLTWPILAQWEAPEGAFSKSTHGLEEQAAEGRGEASQVIHAI
jgi:hypothetical protein